MGSKVFISYAGRDPQWPAEVVRAMALTLEEFGATVLLDQLHLERQPIPGKLSTSEWRDWMTQALQTADRVVCLASERYEQATRRSLDEDWGYGVAFESLNLIAALYQQKGHNDKRILTVRPDGAPKHCVPLHMRDAVPDYQWPSERHQMLEHAVIRRLPAVEGARLEVSRGQDGEQNRVQEAVAPSFAAASADAGLIAQARHAQLKLEAHRGLFDAVIVNPDGDLRQIAPAAAVAAPGPFVTWLAQASRDHAQQVMWAVRSALDHEPALCSHGAAQEAAVAVYMLCALRWVAGKPADDSATVVSVPTLGCNVLAVLSAAFFGGQIQYALKSGPAQPLHVYDVRAPAGESAGTNLLRAIYCALFADEAGALEVARRDDEDPKVVDEMLQRLRVRLNDIRSRRKLAFTLVIDRAQPFEEAAWKDRLGVKPFVLDRTLAKAMFLVDPHELDQEIQELLRQLRPLAAPALSSESATLGPAAAMNPPAQINVQNLHLHGDHANLTMGHQSPITSHVQQTQTTVSLQEFQALLAALQAAIAQLPSSKAREKLTAEAAVIEDAVATKPSDGKSRITKALEAIKHVGDAADGAEAVVDKVTKLTALAAPILAALF